MLTLPTIEHSPGLAAQVAAGAACAERVTAKAVTRRGERLWLLHSPVWDCYKFPGGGVEGGESHAAALTREMREEAGAALGELGPCLLTVTELSAAGSRRRGIPDGVTLLRLRGAARAAPAAA
ncbi:NUDIX domain-containing protein [Deinococcus lacus]|uniref:NUDIX domain-containing protein n=1 Tax=Deinococcus lacus TaxID=392561 RepID=A0ABW1YEE0_9DEIO